MSDRDTMTRKRSKPRKVLVIDIGGSHVKCLVTGQRRHRKFDSGAKLSPQEMVDGVLKLTKGWKFDVISMGYPGVVIDNAPVSEPHNLGTGWVGFDYQSAFGYPVRIINDAAMQAFGAYDGGKMLFLGLGTGLGSALIVNGIVEAMELGHLPCGHGHTYEHYLGDKGRKRMGNKKWRRKVEEVVEGFRRALLPEYIVLGGGNAEKLKNLAPLTRRGTNADAFKGGFRLWERNDPMLERFEA